MKCVIEIRSGWPADVTSVLLGLFAVYEHHLFRLLQGDSFGNIKRQTFYCTIPTYGGGGDNAGLICLASDWVSSKELLLQLKLL